VLQSKNPSTPGILKHLRPGNVDYIDILFVHTAAFLAANPDMNLQITLQLELTNTIFSQSHIPLEVRAAGASVLARSRAFTGGDPILAACGGPTSPAWVEIQAPVRPIFNPDAVPPAWTTGYANGAANGVYGPLYVDAVTGTMGAALDWIRDNSNSLIYGDQYWRGGTAAFLAAPNNPQPFINLPEGFRWEIVPEYDDASTPNDNANTFTFAVIGRDGNPRTRELGSGPVEHPESSHALVYGHPPAVPLTPPPGNTMGISHGAVEQYNEQARTHSKPVRQSPRRRAKENPAATQ
jgi:hypothetical protein